MKKHRHAPTEHARWERNYDRRHWRQALAGYCARYKNPAIIEEVKAISSKVSRHNAARAVALCCGIINEETLYTGRHWYAVGQAGYTVREFFRTPRRRALLNVCLRHMREIAAAHDWE